MTVKVGESKSIIANTLEELNLIYLETNEEDEFTYTSLNTNIASVSEEGKIEGIALGKTRVNAVSKNLGKTYSVLVNVIENEHTVSPMIVGGDEFAGVLRADRKIMGIWI
ncbi:MAG: hypothetical protein HFJ50_01560 [Clostridia bacterium]|nr:hypothetical protein [Clostridia bacterium]